MGAAGHKTFLERRWSGLDGHYIDFAIKSDDRMECVQVAFEVAHQDFYLTRSPDLGWRLMSGAPPSKSNHLQCHSQGSRHPIYHTLLQIVMDRVFFSKRDPNSLLQVEKWERMTPLPGLLASARSGLSIFQPLNVCLALIDLANLETSDSTHLPLWRRSVRTMIAIANSIQHGNTGCVPLFGDLIDVARVSVLPEVLKTCLFVATLVTAFVWATLVSPVRYDIVIALTLGSLPVQALLFWIPLKWKVDQRARDCSEGRQTLDTAL